MEFMFYDFLMICISLFHIVSLFWLVSPLENPRFDPIFANDCFVARDSRISRGGRNFEYLPGEEREGFDRIGNKLHSHHTS